MRVTLIHKNGHKGPLGLDSQQYPETIEKHRWLLPPYW